MDATSISRWHGLFNALTGAWPLVHMPSFEAVSGPKVDRWLVRTVGGLLVVNGLTQLSAGSTQAATVLSRRLGVGTALTLALIDVRYASTGRIRRIYLLDAAVEFGWAAAWASTMRQSRPSWPRKITSRGLPVCGREGRLGGLLLLQPLLHHGAEVPSEPREVLKGTSGGRLGCRPTRRSCSLPRPSSPIWCWWRTWCLRRAELVRIARPPPPGDDHASAVHGHDDQQVEDRALPEEVGGAPFARGNAGEATWSPQRARRSG